MMKKYIKPEIEVVTIASSVPIAWKSCTGDNKDDYDYITTWEDNKSGLGISCINHEWLRGS